MIMWFWSKQRACIVLGKPLQLHSNISDCRFRSFVYKHYQFYIIYQKTWTLAGTALNYCLEQCIATPNGRRYPLPYRLYIAVHPGRYLQLIFRVKLLELNEPWHRYWPPSWADMECIFSVYVSLFTETVILPMLDVVILWPEGVIQESKVSPITMQGTLEFLPAIFIVSINGNLTVPSTRKEEKDTKPLSIWYYYCHYYYIIYYYYHYYCYYYYYYYFIFSKNIKFGANVSIMFKPSFTPRIFNNGVS